MKKLFIFLFTVFLLVLGVFLWWNNGLMPADANNKSSMIFVVNQGESIRTIANNMKRANLIRDPIIFFLLIKQKGTEQKIQAGDFRLSPSEDASKIADDITHGVLDIWVTIPEGKRAEEIAEIFKEKLPSYDNSWEEKLKANEGHLFPDTYLIPRSADSNFILSMMRNNFNSHFKTITNTTNFSDAQLLTIASLVEREAKFPEDRPLIASVIANRLKIDMALQIDATIEYALGYQSKENSWWKKSLTSEDIQYPSAYNTYLTPGLPPGPICSPGASALEAAAHPASTDYLYYVADKSGHSHFAKTLDEHNANIRKYGL